MASSPESSMYIEFDDICVKQAKIIRRPPEAYKNESKPARGAIFIANYREFRNLPRRDGSEEDVKYIIELYSQMGYKLVESIQDRTKKQTVEAMKTFGRNDIHNEVDSMVLFVMSHGEYEDRFFTSDDEVMTSQEVYEIFNNDCPALKLKPKFFIFQHCRNGQLHSTALPQKKVKTLSDTMTIYSTLPGNGSFRHRMYGSPFIHQMCEVFMNHSWQDELEDLINKLNKGILSQCQHIDYREIRKAEDFYFNPESLDNNMEQKLSEQPKVCYDKAITSQAKQQMISPENKLVLLINNLDGCVSDMDKLKYVFHHDLGYRVFGPSQNLTNEALKDVINDFKKQSHGESAIIIFYGDGFNDYIVTSDHSAVHFKELQRLFNDINCPSLSKKPKIFLTNLCYFDGDITYDRTNSDSQDLISPVQDMFFLNVEVEGNNHCENGSLLTEALCRVLKNDRNTRKPVMKTMRAVSKTLDELQEGMENYICELRSIKFPPNFALKPRKHHS